MTIQNLYKNTIRHRKNNGWLQKSGQSEKPENDTKLKILKISKNYHKPSLLQGLERFFKVTPCNEKCNFFILLQNIPLFRILLINIIPLCRDRTSLFSSVGGDSDPRSYILMKSNMSNQWIRTTENDTKFVTVTNSCDLKKMALNPV